ncbi:maleylacetoacetate isomerase [Rhodoplanes roseus]|uniref:Maleylacetoacetate isomerase n=1 Tax=Rhodoplanes roseus TaxID=29409 RepID=A0A327KF58_9BRAD|nr:maleylacetoacetate isomerase [Rhodoplanes roseus]RAI37410.1 maleylacetoacetate isomerase [Rhodoplanes roseus]
MAVKLYSFWRSLATYRVRIAMALKGVVPDEIVTIDLTKGDQHGDAYAAVNPMHALPALVDGDGPPLVQSLAIIEYLDETRPQPPLLPAAPRGRARVRSLALMVAADAHPLMVPRVREYLENELGIPEADRTQWCRHWVRTALVALETRLAGESETGRFCHGDTVTLADICLVSQVAGAGFYEVDTTSFPTVRRIAEACSAVEAFATAHPLRQPGAPGAA